MNSYDLSRVFWNWAFENPDKVKPIHSAIYFFAIEHCNRLGWKSKFGFPTTMVMEAIGVKSYNTYLGGLLDLDKFGFIEMIEKSKNQYSANIIALSKNDKALDNALDKAFIKHDTKQSESTGQSIDSIDKQITINKETINNDTDKTHYSVTETFDMFWEHYHTTTQKKKESKEPAFKQWKKLSLEERRKAYVMATPYSKTNEEKYLVKARTYLSDKRFNDEFELIKKKEYDRYGNEKLDFGTGIVKV